MHAFLRELYPICRSITGDGVRATLGRVNSRLPLTIHEVATGTPVFDWIVPKEWNIRDAAIIDAAGQRVVDFQRLNLHVLNYSTPVHRRMRLDELRPHLHTLSDQPELVPYRTSYYAERWGFCLTQRQLDTLTDDQYEVYINSSLEDGSLTYGECVIPGAGSEEFLLSCHVCHPSLANDNLSGIVVLTWLGQRLSRRELRHTYRLLFIPGTIGSLTWLSRNENVVPYIRWGLTVAGVGDAGDITYKRSRQGDAEIDRAVRVVLRDRSAAFDIQNFSPYGYDERQFCSPGFNLPVGCMMRTPHNSYPEYHTSADNPSFVQEDSLADALAALEAVVNVIETNVYYRNLSPKGEPQLGRRGLYPSMGGPTAKAEQLAMLWVLNLADGSHSLLDMAERSGVAYHRLQAAAVRLASAGLLEEIS